MKLMNKLGGSRNRNKDLKWNIQQFSCNNVSTAFEMSLAPARAVINAIELLYRVSMTHHRDSYEKLEQSYQVSATRPCQIPYGDLDTLLQSFFLS